MDEKSQLEPIKRYYEDKLAAHGPTPQGIDLGSAQAVSLRYEQLVRLWDPASEPSIVDYGCGYGGLVDYLAERGQRFRYWGYDLSEQMLAAGRTLHAGRPHCAFTAREDELPQADYAVASGIFNVKLDATDEQWTGHVLETLDKLDRLGRRGFAFNLLTSYSDRERMRPELYYPDPCFYFDHCKRHFSRNVALLHDYGLYDFTILVRKEVP